MEHLFGAHLPAWLVLILDIALKSSILVLVTLIVTGIQKKVSAAVKHFVLSMAFVLLALLPFVIVFAPSIDFASYFQSESTQGPQSVSTATSLSTSAPFSEYPEPFEFFLDGSQNGVTTTEIGFSDLVLSALPQVLFYVWLTGVIFILARLVIGMFFIWRKSLDSGAIIESQWGTWVNEYKEKLNIQRPVILLRSHHNDSPVTWGTFRPLILLPQNSVEWSDERIQAVLMHEMAHISRWDTLLQALAQVSCAIHWMNPLVWIAYREFIIEREHACDDMVLSVGIKPSNYASELVDIARESVKASSFSTLSAIHMARPSQLKDRIQAILEQGRARVAVSRKEVEMGMLGALLFLLPAAFYWPWVVQKSGALSESIGSIFASSEPETVSAFQPQPLRPNIPAFEEAMKAWEHIENDRAERLRDLESAHAFGGFKAQAHDATLEAIAWGKSAVNKEMLQTYMNAAKDPSSNVRFEAIKNLVRHYDIPEVKALLYDRAINDDSSNIRYAALNSLRSDRSTQTFEVMINATNDVSANVRYLAVSYLRNFRFDERAIDAVRARMNDESSNVRYAAFQILRGQRGEGVKQALLEASKDESSNIRFQVVQELRAFMSDPAVKERIQQMTTDESSNVRFKALQMLGQTNPVSGLTDSQKYDALVEAALQGSEASRINAIQAIGRLEDPYFIEKLATLANDPSLAVRVEFATMLGRIEDRLAVPLLGKMSSDGNLSLRMSVIDAMARIEDSSALPYLARILKTNNEAEQIAVLKALGRIEDVNAIPVIANFVRGIDLSFPIMIQVAETIARIEEPAGLVILESMMDEPMNASVKLALLKAYGRIQDPSSLPSVIEIMKSDNNQQVILAGLDALGRIQDERALPTVSEYISSDNEAVKSAAIKAFSKIN